MNKELLKEVAVAIRQHPKQVNMYSWTNSQNGVREPADGCGTAGCIAAWIVATGDKVQLKHLGGFVKYQATSLADIEYRDAQRLFLASDWPPIFALRLSQAETAQDYADVVADRLETFIETEGVV